MDRSDEQTEEEEEEEEWRKIKRHKDNKTETDRQTKDENEQDSPLRSFADSHSVYRSRNLSSSLFAFLLFHLYQSVRYLFIHLFVDLLYIARSMSLSNLGSELSRPYI